MSKFISDEALAAWFSYHAPSTPKVVQAHEQIRESCHLLAQVFNSLLPEGPDKTVALRAVREAMYHANACLALAQRVGSGESDSAAS